MENDFIIDYLRENWENESIEEIKFNLQLQEGIKIKLYDIFEAAYKLGYYKESSMEIRRSWSEDDQHFLQDYSQVLNVREAANILQRSRYATYQQVKLLGLKSMINKKNLK